MTDDHRLTLESWQMTTGATIGRDYGSPQSVYVYADEKTPRFSDLWNLKDYVVSTRSGPIVWMVPRA